MVRARAQVTAEPAVKSPTCSQRRGDLPSEKLRMLRSTEPIFDCNPADKDRNRLQVTRMRYYVLSTPVRGARWGQSVAFRVDNES
jgi:hypothetical protein